MRIFRVCPCLVATAMVVSALAGCASTPPGRTVVDGMDPRQVRGVYGTPDVITEAAGDETRTYFTSNKFRTWPMTDVYVWPSPHLRIWYYIERDTAVRFEDDKVIAETPITPEDTVRMSVTEKYEREPWTGPLPTGGSAYLCWDEFVPMMCKTLREDGDPKERAIVAILLAQRRESRAVDALGDVALKDPDARVRRIACHALSRMPKAKAARYLTAAVKDGDENVRQAARQSLAMLRVEMPS